MAVKARNRKKKESAETWAKAVKIRCCYCDAKETCKFRERKEKDENRGITTYCTQTPNVIGKKKKKAKAAPTGRPKAKKNVKKA